MVVLTKEQSARCNTTQAAPATAVNLRFDLTRKEVVYALMVYSQYIEPLGQLTTTAQVKGAVKTVLQNYGSSFSKLHIEDKVYLKKVDLEIEIDRLKLHLFKS